MPISFCTRTIIPITPASLLRHRRRSFSSLHLQHTTTTSSPPKPTLTATAPTPNPSSHQNLLLQTLSSRQKQQISLYVGTLLEWNQRMNLTAVKEEEEVMTRHVEDSLAILPPLRCSYISRCGTSSSCEKLRIIDVGTGAGIPGLIFAVACPGWEVTLLESMQKRCLFLEHAVQRMRLSNVQILCNRAESAGQKHEFRQMFDVAVARAVAEMRILGAVALIKSMIIFKFFCLHFLHFTAEYCLPLVRVGGLFVAAKGHDPREETKSAENTIRLMGASVLDLCPVESHSPHGQRTVVICLKDRVTPRKYPRQPGIPSKIPL